MTHLRKKLRHEERFIKCLDVPSKTLTGLDCTRRRIDLNKDIDRYMLRAHELRSQAFTRFSRRTIGGLLQSIRGGNTFITEFSSRVLNSLTRNHERQVSSRKVKVFNDRMLKDIGLQRCSFNSESDKHLEGFHVIAAPSICFATTFTSATPIISDNRL